MKPLLSLLGCLQHATVPRRMSVFGLFALLVLLGAPAAQAQLTFIPSGQAGFTTQTYTNTKLKTVDADTVTLANAPGLTFATTLGSGGGAFGYTTLTANGFSGRSMLVISGTGSSAGSKVVYTFAGGTPYVSFLWNLRTGDSDNTVKFNLSNGTSVSVSNCASATTTCVGGYDNYNFFSSLFSIILGTTSQSSTQTARLVYQPPSGVTVTSMELSAVRIRTCTLFIICSNQTRYFSLDALSYVDNSVTQPSGLHHLEILSDRNSAVTCQTSTFKVRACADASCSTNYTGGVTGNLTLTGATGVSYPSGAAFTIPAGSSTSGNISVRTTTAGTLTAGASGVSPAPTATGYCGLGALASNTAGACTYTTRSSGLVLSLPNHRSGTTQTLNLNLVQNVAGSCVAVSSGGTLGTTVTATYAGATQPTLGGNALASGVPKVINLAFNAAGLSTSAFQFNNSGPVQLRVALTSSVSGLLSGLVGSFAQTVTYVAPASFKVEPIINGVTGTASSVVGAGNTIQLKISALNGLSTPSVTTNYGSETGIDPIAITRSLLKPTSRKSGAPNNPTPTLGAIVFNNGVATVDFTWTEVGSLDLTATLGDYLDTGMSVTGALSSVIPGGLRFVPESFTLTPAAKCGAFTYAGQPFDTVITAINQTGATTLNYDGSAANAANRAANTVTVSALSGAVGGSFTSGNTVAATAFGDGTATSSMTYTVANKLTAPSTVVMRATDPDVADSTNPSMSFRSGRIKLSNAFGSESQALQIPMQVQYWSGKSWVPASDDTCTTASLLPVGKVSLGNIKSHQGVATTALSAAVPSALNLASGLGNITLAAPGARRTGTIDVTLDLSATGANLPWLQSLDVSCGANTVCNPKARATFGVYSPETQKTINIQNVN